MKTIVFLTSFWICFFAHAHGDQHEGEGANVGVDKGILEAHEKEGIKLSPEALKTFEIRTLRLIGAGPWTVPASAKLQSGEEVNVYRLRDSFFRRSDFKIVKSDRLQMTIQSLDLKPGDEIVVSGIGYLRIAEIAAFGGTPDEH